MYRKRKSLKSIKMQTIYSVFYQHLYMGPNHFSAKARYYQWLKVVYKQNEIHKYFVESGIKYVTSKGGAG